jgi:hypothetical protein
VPSLAQAERKGKAAVEASAASTSRLVTISFGKLET